MITNVIRKKHSIELPKNAPQNTLRFDQIKTGFYVTTNAEKPQNQHRGQHYISKDVILLVSEFCVAETRLAYTQQQGYIKLQFRLSGNNTVILDHLGELDIEQPQLLITAGPQDLLKADWLKKNIRYRHVSLCIKPSFFTSYLALAPDELPNPLRALASDELKPTAHRSLISADLLSALHSLLNLSCSNKMLGSYYEAKAIELMCLLINQFENSDPACKTQGTLSNIKTQRLHEVRDMLMQEYAQPITLVQISKMAGFSKTALTTGFRQLFGLSVYDFIQQQRMLKAMELLRSSEQSIAQISEAVGYKQACNFSTAFREYYGCPPNSLHSK